MQPFARVNLTFHWPGRPWDNRPLYLLLSGFARGQALGCHAVARADRMQKTHWKVCRNTSEITEKDWSVVLNRWLPVSTFSPNHWSWRCHLLAPHWAEIDRLAYGAERAREIKEKQLAIADAGAAAAAAQSEGETSSRRACGSRKADRGTQGTWGRNRASTCLLECENTSSKVALSHTLFWERERNRRLAEAFISGLSVVQWEALWKALGIELKEKILSQSVLLTRKEAGRTWEELVGWQWWPLKTICSWWPVWGSGSGGCSRSWHTFLVCRRLVCHSPFKKWISFLYLRLGRLPPWPYWEDVKASMAECFHANYPDTFIVLDATELCTEIRSCLALQSQLYSSYKSRTTLKDLIDISPNGSIYFVSELWSGSISDRELVIKSVMFCLSNIFFYHHIHKQCYHSTFFFFFNFLSSFICCLLIRMIASQASCFVFQKKNSNHRIHKHCSLSIPLFF